MTSHRDISPSLQDISVSRARLCDQVITQLQNLILDGHLRPGDRLPPERELADQLGVSRTVIREAFKALEEKGLVYTLTGSGTYIAKADGQLVSESIHFLMRQGGSSFEHLFELRRVLEVEIAGLAAERRTDEDLAALEQTIRDMEEPLVKMKEEPANFRALVEQHIAADLAFHQHLAAATQNPLFQLILAPISDQLLDFRLRQALGLPQAMEDGLRDHQALLQNVKARRVDECRQGMREHLEHAERQWYLAQEGSK